jgi:hypothetical protein
MSENSEPAPARARGSSGSRSLQRCRETPSKLGGPQDQAEAEDIVALIATVRSGLRAPRTSWLDTIGEA